MSMIRTTRFELAAEELIAEHGVRVRGIVASGEGAAFPADRSIDAPAPITAAGFVGVAHEIAHVGQADGPRASEWVKELAAWRWALRMHGERSLPGKRQAVEHAASCLETYTSGLGRLQLRRLLTAEHVDLTVHHDGRVD
jgi:hypothetical protein